MGGSVALVVESGAAPSATVSAWSFTDFRPGLQPFDVPRELRRGSRRNAMRNRDTVECLGEVGQGRGNDLLCFPGSKCTPAFRLADQVGGADAPVIEAAVDGEREVAVDPPFLKEVRDGVVDVGKYAAPGEVKDGEVLGMGVVITEEHGESEPAQEIGHRVPLSLE